MKAKECTISGGRGQCSVVVYHRSIRCSINVCCGLSKFLFIVGTIQKSVRVVSDLNSVVLSPTSIVLFMEKYMFMLEEPVLCDQETAFSAGIMLSARQKCQLCQK